MSGATTRLTLWIYLLLFGFVWLSIPAFMASEIAGLIVLGIALGLTVFALGLQQLIRRSLV